MSEQSDGKSHGKLAIKRFQCITSCTGKLSKGEEQRLRSLAEVSSVLKPGSLWVSLAELGRGKERSLAVVRSGAWQPWQRWGAEFGRHEKRSLAETRSGAWQRRGAELGRGEERSLAGGTPTLWGTVWSLEVLDGVCPAGNFNFLLFLRACGWQCCQLLVALSRWSGSAAQPKQTVAWPKTWWCFVFTWNLAPCGFTRCNPERFITCHGTIPMPTSWRTTSGIHRLRPACGRRERPQGIAHGVRILLNRSSVTDRYQRKFAQDTLNENDVQDRYLVVKRVYHTRIVTRSNRLYPMTPILQERLRKQSAMVAIMATICITVKTHFNTNNCNNGNNMYNKNNHHFQELHKFPTGCWNEGTNSPHNRRSWIQCRS
jgi:hypothetical protein